MEGWAMLCSPSSKYSASTSLSPLYHVGIGGWFSCVGRLWGSTESYTRTTLWLCPGMHGPWT
jgi:hypothetical protein